MLISDQGTLVRTRVGEVSTVGRNTQGVRLIRTGEDEHVVGLQRIDEIEELEEDLEALVEGDEAIEIEATDVDSTTDEDPQNEE